jgi:hypothetical protein
VPGKYGRETDHKQRKYKTMSTNEKKMKVLRLQKETGVDKGTVSVDTLERLSLTLGGVQLDTIKVSKKTRKIPASNLDAFQSREMRIDYTDNDGVAQTLLLNFHSI